MIVVDSNIFFSALISKNSLILDTLLSDSFRFVAPNFVFTEIFNHKEKILKHSKLTGNEFLELFNHVFSKIEFIPYNFISFASFAKAYDLCKSIDEKDTVFVALAIELNAELWTGDKPLKDGLSAKDLTSFLLYLINNYEQIFRTQLR